MSTRNITASLLLTFALVVITNKAVAVPTQMVHQDTPQCDTLFIPDDVHELGDFAIFPPNEAIDSFNLGTAPIIPCPATNDPLLPEVFIDIRNLTGIAWQEVWYVADPETTITNFDGEANDIGFAPLQEAFRIDTVGNNQPLVSESTSSNGIFDIGESWQFVLQDYTNSLGLTAEAFTSIGVGNASNLFPGTILSSGSIIAFNPIPEPTSVMLMAMAIVSCLVLRRKLR